MRFTTEPNMGSNKVTSREKPRHMESSSAIGVQRSSKAPQKQANLPQTKTAHLRGINLRSNKNAGSHTK